MEDESENEDYVLRWPRKLFQTETAQLLNRRDSVTDWSGQSELLLEDAFATTVPRDDFLAAEQQVGLASDPWSPPFERAATRSGLEAGQEFLVRLLRRADRLPESTMRVPYFSQRRNRTAPGAVSLRTTVQEFARLADDLESRGYFERVFGKDCVDDRSYITPASVVASQLGAEDLWPPPVQRLTDNPDLFFDLIEVCNDLIAAPRSRSFHSYSECGYHHGDFSTSRGRAVYRWEVNRILDRSGTGWRLAEDGEDRGRLVAVTDDARTSLASRMSQREDLETGDDVRHAIALFRGRGSGRQEKRSACIALAGVLEKRRNLLKDELLSKDEGALFQIANQFGIRHQNAQQRADYDPVFLDWVFWFYLGTIELTDRILARDTVETP